MVTYRDVLRIVLGNLYRAVISSIFMGLPSWAMTKKLLEMKWPLKEVEKYISKMMDEERAGLSGKEGNGDNLLSVLLKASESEAMGKEKSGLSDQEIIGNLFTYNVAGHGTTVNTIVYVVYMLSTDVRMQDWLREELDAVFGETGSFGELELRESIPAAKKMPRNHGKLFLSVKLRLVQYEEEAKQVS